MINITGKDGNPFSKIINVISSRDLKELATKTFNKIQQAVSPRANQDMSSQIHINKAMYKPM